LKVNEFEGKSESDKQQDTLEVKKIGANFYPLLAKPVLGKEN
jgi:hypothetical protein